MWKFQEKKRESERAEIIFEDRIAENSPNFVNINLYIQESWNTPSRINKRKSISRHIIAKLSKDKERTLKEQQGEKTNSTYTRTSQWEWQWTHQNPRKPGCHKGVINSKDWIKTIKNNNNKKKLLVKNKGKIKTLQVNKIRKLVARKPALEILKGILQVEITGQFSSVHSLSHVQLFVTPWTTAHQTSLSITNSQNPPKPMCIDRVSDAIQPSLPLPSLLLLPSICPSIRAFSNESALHMRWPKYWTFSFNISPSNEHPGLISFRMDWLDLLAVQGTLKSLLQHNSSKASILLRSAFFKVQLSHRCMTTGKTIALTRWTFAGKVISVF